MQESVLTPRKVIETSEHNASGGSFFETALDHPDFGYSELTPRYQRPYPTETVLEEPSHDSLPENAGLTRAPSRVRRLYIPPFHPFGNTNGRTGAYAASGILDYRQKRSGPFFFDGWIAQGVTFNFHWPQGETNGPLKYNDVSNEYDLNQLYLTFGKNTDKSSGRCDWGFRADLLYGSDYLYTGALGLETRTYSTWRPGYGSVAEFDPVQADLHWNANSGPRRSTYHPAAMYGLSLPQFYGELFLPIGCGTTFRVGHFYAGMGLESAMSPENFFYSHSYSFMYGAPTTLSGATVTQRLSPRWSLLFGITQGWDVWDSPNDTVAWLGGLEWLSRNKRDRIAFTLQADRPSFRDDYRINYALVFNKQLSRNLSYALEHDFGYEENGSVVRRLSSTRSLRTISRWYSVAQQLQLRLSPTLSLGFRAEWFQDNGHARILQMETDTRLTRLEGENYYALTLGLHWKPNRWITIRPEVRYDWSDIANYDKRTPGSLSQPGVFDNMTKQEQITFGMDAVIRF